MSPPSVSTADGSGKSFDLQKYHISYNTGFMLEDPLTSLPPYFDQWHVLASSVPKLLIEKKVREAVSKLPVLDHEKLASYRQLRLAHLQLSYITAAYVWQNGDKDPPQVLPKSLAVPLYEISRKLGLQPVLCHTDLALANWKKKDLNGSYDLDNLECLYHLPGDSEGDWFCLVTDLVELKFALCLKPMGNILDLLQKVSDLKENEISKLLETENQIATLLQELEAAVQTMNAALSRMHENIGASTFFNVLRPFFAGWGGGDGSPLPTGLVYDGISETPLKMHGDTAAQSATLQALDAFLGVEHTTDKRDFLELMRKYIPPDHKRFIEDLEQMELPLKLLVQSSNNKSMKSAYNKCLAAVVNFRTYHIQLVTKYVVIASKEKTGGSSQSSELRGTGGTSLLPFLKTLRSDTEKAKTVNGKRERISWLKLGLVTAVVTVVVGVTFKFYSR